MNKYFLLGYILPVIIEHFISVYFVSFNSIPNDKIMDQSKLKALADDQTIVISKFKFVKGLVENILGKRRKYRHAQRSLAFNPVCHQIAA